MTPEERKRIVAAEALAEAERVQRLVADYDAAVRRGDVLRGGTSRRERLPVIRKRRRWMTDEEAEDAVNVPWWRQGNVWWRLWHR